MAEECRSVNVDTTGWFHVVHRWLVESGHNYDNQIGDEDVTRLADAFDQPPDVTENR